MIDLRRLEPVKLVNNVLIERVADDQVMVLLLGDPKPKLGMALTPDQARHLAEKLVEHADALEASVDPGAPEVEP